MRLIDADDFYQKIKYDTDICAEMENNGEMALKKYIDLQPTVYDVEKVVEQLEEQCFPPYNYPGYAVDLELAIKIVKDGGIMGIMDRVTKRIKRVDKDDLIVYTKGKYEDTIPAEMTKDDIREVLKRLAEYEDCVEQLNLEALHIDKFIETIKKTLKKLNKIFRYTESEENKK